MAKLILKDIVDEIPFGSLPVNRQGFDLKKFSIQFVFQYKLNVNQLLLQ